MRKIKRILYGAYINVINSIAFYPAFISVGFLLFSFLIMSVEYQPFMLEVKKAMGVVLVKGEDNGRLILGTITGSIFSLMVFSFSMVMLVLNRASATLSPRVIPGLITKKAHQVVLGVYLGTIIYSLVIVTNIQSIDDKMHMPTFGIFLSMVFAIACLGLFVYFIHSISRAIQVDNILDSIFHQTAERMNAYEEKDELLSLPDTSDWQTIYTDRAGYMKQLETNALAKICKKHGIVVATMEHKGFFLVKGYPFLKVNKKIDKDLEEELKDCFLFYIEERVSDHYLFGFKQISEIALKALSPGINDPGTAIKAIDMLSVLFIKKMTMKEKHYVDDEEGNVLVVFKNPSLEELLYLNLTPIREYGKGDANVMINLLESLKNLAYTDKGGRKFQPVLSKYIKSMVSSCRGNIDNDLDMEQLNKVIEEINKLLGEDYHVDALGK